MKTFGEFPSKTEDGSSDPAIAEQSHHSEEIKSSGGVMNLGGMSLGGPWYPPFERDNATAEPLI
jgi:hypothetical protein